MGVLTAQLEVRLRRLAAAAAASRETAKADQEARDLAIIDADDAGLGVREIARLTELSPTQVQRVLLRETVSRQTAARSTSASSPVRGR